MGRKGVFLSLCILLVSVCSISFADSVNVGYTVTGGPGNWTLDFSVNNNTILGQDLYFFGVNVGTITNYPSGWVNDGVWVNQVYAGESGLTYNNTWTDLSFTRFPFGATLGGFDVHVTDLTAPTSVNWFAYSLGSTPYTAPDSFGPGFNPGFEGVATANSATPEPATLMLLGTGLLGLGRKFRK